MRKSRKIVFAVSTAMALTLAGCGSDKKAEEVVPTVAPTATPTIPPVTATPAPSSTPRKIGEKTSQSKFVYLTNNLKTDVRELYLMVSGSEDWGDNLIPREFSVKASDQVQMFYTPESVQASAEEEDSEENSAPSGALYDMKLVTADGNSYEIYSIELSDMEKASLTLDEETSTAYLRYMSLSEKKEKDTKENSQQTGYGDDYDSEDDSYSDDGSYDDGSYDDGNSDDGYYDDGSSDDGNYDDGGSDDGNYDDGGSDDGNYDDGGSDDGSSGDGGSDDGDYDDGGSDDGSGDDYVDAGDGEDDGYYDTEE